LRVTSDEEVSLNILTVREYQGGMPTLPCPGCEGDTMEFVEEDG
jgi:hypothetical protein